MADSYLEFSEVLPCVTADEEAWLRAQLAKAEPSQVRRSTKRRFVLYDFDAQKLAATSVYDHPAEAADAASALANVIVLPIQIEGGGTTEQSDRLTGG
jgi:hypothetical protein